MPKEDPSPSPSAMTRRMAESGQRHSSWKTESKLNQGASLIPNQLDLITGPATSVCPLFFHGQAGNFYFPGPGSPLLIEYAYAYGGQGTLTGPRATTWVSMWSPGGGADCSMATGSLDHEGYNA